jgi:hypothetical protein
VRQVRDRGVELLPVAALIPSPVLSWQASAWSNSIASAPADLAWPGRAESSSMMNCRAVSVCPVFGVTPGSHSRWTLEY